MKIELFTSDYHGLMISGDDFMFYLSLRGMIVIASIALVVAGFRRVRKVRGI
jgi:hypothetical protein